MTNNISEEFVQYFKKIGNRITIYKEVIKKYKINSILYPGSHIDIAPSFIISKVTYLDNFKGTIKIFKILGFKMNKVILNLAISFDGMIDDENKKFDWIHGDGDKNHDTKKHLDFLALLKLSK
jgi:hypothetical protein